MKKKGFFRESGRWLLLAGVFFCQSVLAGAIQSDGADYWAGETIYIGDVNLDTNTLDFSYEKTYDNTAAITEYKGFEQDIVIPEKLDYLPVKEIRSLKIRQESTMVYSIEIPKTVEKIADGAFSECDTLLRFIVPADHPFFVCFDGILYEKKEKALVCCPQGYWSGSLVVPNGVRSIRSKAFYGAYGIQSLQLPGSIQKIEGSAFLGCSPYLEVLPAQDSYFAMIGDALVDQSTGTLIRVFCEYGGTYTVPDGVTAVGAYAFAETCGISKVVVPDGVIYIGDHAFDGAADLMSLELPDTVRYVGPDAFENCPALTITWRDNAYLQEYCDLYGVDYQ